MAASTADPAADIPSVDTEALRRKYEEERLKRVRADGNAQYVAITGRYAHYLDDPYVEPGFTRDPVQRDMDVLVVGGGFGGLLAAARLRAAGYDDLCIIEKGGDFGGTWYWNRYPGAACDTESYIYMPLLEETGYMPVSKYAKAPELLEHSRASAGTSPVPGGAVPDGDHRHALAGRRSRRPAGWSAPTVHDALKRPLRGAGRRAAEPAQAAGHPGASTRFKGHSFHTSRWDYAYTGGSSMGGADLAWHDKRVGIIGTGATAVQCVPHLGAGAKRAVRVPAHAVVGGRAQRPAHRSGLGQEPEARLAARAHGTTSPR